MSAELEEDRPQFSVFVFYTDGSYYSQDDWRWHKCETAVRIAIRATRQRPPPGYEVASIIITDGGDFTCWEWKPGLGITFPPELEGRFK